MNDNAISNMSQQMLNEEDAALASDLRELLGISIRLQTRCLRRLEQINGADSMSLVRMNIASFLATREEADYNTATQLITLIRHFRPGEDFISEQETPQVSPAHAMARVVERSSSFDWNPRDVDPPIHSIRPSILQRSDSVRSPILQRSDSIQPSILQRNDSVFVDAFNDTTEYFPPPPLVRNDSMVAPIGNGPQRLVRTYSQSCPFVYDLSEELQQTSTLDCSPAAP